jgi:hypothetical protein
MTSRFQGKVVIVNAGTGIVAATARRFYAENAARGHSRIHVDDRTHRNAEHPIRRVVARVLKAESSRKSC